MYIIVEYLFPEIFQAEPEPTLEPTTIKGTKENIERGQAVRGAEMAKGEWRLAIRRMLDA